MIHRVPACLLLSAMTFHAISRVAAGLSRTGQKVRSHGRSEFSSVLARHPRSIPGLPEESPCVTIPFLSELKNRFVSSLDHNNDGIATFHEVKEYMRKFKPNVKDDAVRSFISRRDTNGNGAIDFVPEYVHDMSASDYSMSAALEWFHLHDTNDDGFVTESELMNASEALGMTPEQALETVQGYYMAADVNGDGKLSFDEFKTLYDQ
ncbi:hypothetical protein BsWGS_09605 [Bradybaena similaris]